MFRDDRSRSACTGLQPVLGSARRSPRSRVAGVCEDVRKISPPQVRVEGSVWCPRAPAFGRACRIMLRFPVHGASLCKAGKTGHVTARCSCAGAKTDAPWWLAAAQVSNCLHFPILTFLGWDLPAARTHSLSLSSVPHTHAFTCAHTCRVFLGGLSAAGGGLRGQESKEGGPVNPQISTRN